MQRTQFIAKKMSQQNDVYKILIQVTDQMVLLYKSMDLSKVLKFWTAIIPRQLEKVAIYVQTTFVYGKDTFLPAL